VLRRCTFRRQLRAGAGWSFGADPDALRSAARSIWVELPQGTTPEEWTLIARSEWSDAPASIPVLSSIQSKYHNGTGVNRELRGKVLVEQVRDGTGQRLSMKINTWEAMPVAGLPNTKAIRCVRNSLHRSLEPSA
jgi:hypothetical protein